MKMIVYFLMKYSYQNSCNKDIMYLDYEENLIDYKLGREEYSGICDRISISQTEIKDCKEGQDECDYL